MTPIIRDPVRWPIDPETTKALDLADGLALPLGLDGNQKLIMPNESKVLLSNFRTVSIADVELYYVISLSGTESGFAFAASYVPDAKYQDSIVIDSRAKRHFAIAHEIMHFLNDSGHYVGQSFIVNLLRSYPDNVDYLEATKRIRSQQDLEMNGDPSATPAVPAKRQNLMN